jgi:transportin-1
MEGLLRTVLDANKKVQEAGCSAFATLEEEAGAELVPFLEPILRNLTHAFTKYQQKNMLILYDAIGTLADAVGAALGQPLYMQILMPPIIERWLKLGDQDPDLIPLLEVRTVFSRELSPDEQCLSSVSIAASGSFAEYAQPVYQRCLSIIHATLTQYQQYESAPEQFEEPDRTFIVVSLDLLSGLTQGLGEPFSQLITSHQPPLLHLMAVCLTVSRLSLLAWA